MLSDAGIRRVQRHAIHTFELWYERTGRFGTRLDHIGDAAVFQWPSFPAELFNRAMGLGDSKPTSLEAVQRIVCTFQEIGVPGIVQISPLSKRNGTEALLETAGLRQQGAMGSFVLHADEWNETHLRINDAIEIQKVEDSNSADFCRVLLDSFGITPEFEPFLRETVDLPFMDNFLALYEGEPAGAGQLATVSGVSGLYSGGVLERFRGKGIQSALIHHRIGAAVENSVTLLYSGTEDVEGQSSRNLRRCGFTLGFELENWVVNDAS